MKGGTKSANAIDAEVGEEEVFEEDDDAEVELVEVSDTSAEIDTVKRTRTGTPIPSAPFMDRLRAAAAARGSGHGASS